MSKQITVRIDSSLEGRRIENILKQHLGFSSSLVKRLKTTENSITLNKEIVPLVKRVSLGDELIVTLTEKRQEDILPVNLPIDILFEDEDIILLNKPTFMPTHPSPDHYTDTLANAVMYHFNGKFSFHVITRLDRETSGVVLIAKNTLAAHILTDAMKNQMILKEYVAVVNGTPTPSVGEISAPIKKAEGLGIRRIVAPDGKTAVTKYAVEKTNEDFSLVRLNPVTGRTHQIRVHMSFIGTPIFGDSLYGEALAEERTRLHCRKIAFQHPFTKELLEIEAPVPTDITDLIL